MNVIITGTSRGIGLALSQKFLEQPEHQVIALSRNITPLQTLAQSLHQEQRLKIAAFDLATYEHAQLMSILDHWDRVDLLINNAGALIHLPFREMNLQQWKQIFEVNLFAPVRLIQDVLPFMEKSEAAHIVNIGSMGGIQGSVKFPGMSAYSASKAALASLTECLAEELKKDNIRVNCLCPGAVNTEMFREAFPDFTAPVESKDMADFIYQFAVQGHRLFNGKVLPISSSTP
ncbi:MAG: SDR family oxidoreductase [Bacteroidota bacterium]